MGRRLVSVFGAPAGTFKTVSAGGYFTCGVRTDDRVACWGYNADGQT